ncbi:hypothetical protein SLEP1_g7825 [Rubroshorea leprosula]|uniref:Bromo domain-containing protein n=1 Tax=Rubroshorea leprosula TaxID=152421 RepID=A0AAV5I5N2_9ROSI|nr:hypothetical protein SLEP1_g7825 [Rubroshorea leprosula]
MVAVTKIKIKCPTIPGPQPCEFGRQPSVHKERGENRSVDSNGQLDIENEQKCLASSLGKKKFLAAGDSRETFFVKGAKKRGPEEMMDGLQEKRQKMDRAMTLQCSAVLKELMSDRWISIFSKPVDPVALNIPDYFSIITSPMDLGTVKCKLGNNTYLDIEDFAADIRLTFSNAMLYNPANNCVHKLAKKLSNKFEARWKTLKGEKSRVGEGKVSSMRMKGNNELRQNSLKAPLLHRNTLCAEAAEAVHCKPVPSYTSNRLGKKLSKGINSGGERPWVTISNKTAVGSGPSKCSTCGSISCQCSLIHDSNHASSSDITSERSMSGDHRACTTDASQLDCLAKSTLTSQMSKSDPDSDGAMSAFDDGHGCLSSELKIPATDAAVSEGLTTTFDVQMSPSKALRAALLKTRFADTILKAQQKTLLDHGDKADPIKIQQEKERMERRQREEKARIEAQIQAAKAAIAAAELKAEMELKKKRERDREAARIALQKVEKTVEFEQNLEILKELEMLSGCSLSTYCLYHKGRSHQTVSGALEGTGIGNPLQLVGLSIKDEYLDDEDEEEATMNEDGEEGEIL